MSFMFTAPELVSAAASELASIGSTLSSANAAAAAPTTALLAAGADEVSAVIASLFAQYGTAYQELSSQAVAFHSQFVQTLQSGAFAYANAEVANAQHTLNSLLNPSAAPAAQATDPVNQFFEALTGRPLIGNGADGITNEQGVGTPGKPGGWLYGNGGNGGNGSASVLKAPGGAGGAAGL
ncbi:PE family protein, partial [Mycobacterium intermedium]